MEENTTVDVSTEFATGSQPDDGAVSEEVSISNLVQDSATQSVEGDAQDTVASTTSRDDSAKQVAKQPDIENSRAFAKRLEQARAKDRQKFQSDPAYLLGQQLIDERAAQEGISTEEALRRIQGERVSQKASEYAKNPQTFYEDMLRGQVAKPPFDQPATPQATAASLTEQLIDAHENGIVPDGFTPKHVDAQFVDYASRFGVAAALERWQGEQHSVDAVVGELQRRQSAPRPIKPQSAGISAAKPDFSSMSVEEFRKYDDAVKRAAYEGKRVVF